MFVKIVRGQDGFCNKNQRYFIAFLDEFMYSTLSQATK